MTGPSIRSADAVPGWASTLAEALDRATRAVVDGAGSVSVLYSGGLDSSLVAHLAKQVGPVELVVIGTDGSKDPAAAEQGARLLDLPIRKIVVGEEDLAAAEQRFATDLEALGEPHRSVALAFGIALSQRLRPRVLVGQGADELFYGYSHFRGLSHDAAIRRARSDWDSLEGTEWPRARRMAGRLGLDLRSPFLDPEVVRIAWTLDPPQGDEPPKAALRTVAELLGVPDPLVRAAKRALQYGSGVHRMAVRRSRAEPARQISS